jgi:hypothetical protein
MMDKLGLESSTFHTRPDYVFDSFELFMLGAGWQGISKLRLTAVVY